MLEVDGSIPVVYSGIIEERWDVYHMVQLKNCEDVDQHLWYGTLSSQRKRFCLLPQC